MQLKKVMMRVAREHGDLGWDRWSGLRLFGLTLRVGRGGEVVFIGIGVGIGMDMQAYVYANKANIEFFSIHFLSSLTVELEGLGV